MRAVGLFGSNVPRRVERAAIVMPERPGAPLELEFETSAGTIRVLLPLGLAHTLADDLVLAAARAAPLKAVGE